MIRNCPACCPDLAHCYFSLATACHSPLLKPTAITIVGNVSQRSAFNPLLQWQTLQLIDASKVNKSACACIHFLKSYDKFCRYRLIICFSFFHSDYCFSSKIPKQLYHHFSKQTN
ncbi:hypothetical protein Tsp_02852 [Trichinella spiralis]|uniref:hypothetical protein n=1 Tax=Trichinella spiralis TaxID=6334 RepID=UPI0001EFC981|nr:hypothetical protein Tsp_02852 [Trichinella spiralis]